MNELDHIHLDECLDAPPPPGDSEWLTVVEELVPQFVARGGAWLIRVPVGQLIALPTSSALSAVELHSLSDRSELLEPPAIYRLATKRIANRWEGETHKWRRSIAPSVMEIVGIARAEREALAGEQFDATVSFEISPD